MGINARGLDQITRGLNALNLPLKEVKMLELGSQRLVKKSFNDRSIKKFENSKKYFQSFGMEHVSFDINNKWESLYVDLSKVQEDWQGYFDILTNYGTTEHVRGGQYQAFKNVHNFVRVGGIMCHCNPMVGRIQLGHPVYDSVYYHEDFYQKLADLNGYEVIEMQVMKDLRRNKKKGGNITCILKKINDEPFCSEADFWRLNAIDDYSRGQSLTKDRFKYAKEEGN